MKCRFCGAETKDDWKFCPKCGSMQRDMFANMDRIINRMVKEMRSMDNFDRQGEVFDISPFFRKMDENSIRIKPGLGGSGFTVRISRSGDKPPKVSVKTFGNVDKSKVIDQVRNRFGIKEKLKPEQIQKSDEGRLRIPGRTEEPKSTIKKMMHKIMIDVELPKVDSLKDVEIKELENSVEIKAVAGDKGYFKILTKPSRFSLIKKELHNGVLHLEFS